MTDRVDIVVREDGSLAVRRRFEDVADSADKAGKSVDTFKNILTSLRSIVGTIGLGVLIKEALGLADAYTGMQNQLRLVANDMGELKDVQRELFDISQDTSTDLRENVSLYSLLSQGARQYGFDAKDMLSVTRTLAQAMDAEGKSSQDAAGAIQALARALATGELNGRGIVAIFQRMPLLATALEQALGAPLSSFKELGREGELSGRKILEALTKSDIIAQAQRQKVDTLSDAWTKVKNSLIQYLGQADQGVGITSGIIQGLNLLASNLNTVMRLLTAGAVIWGTYRLAIIAAGVATSLYSALLTTLAAVEVSAGLATGALTANLTVMRTATYAAAVGVGVLRGAVIALFAVIRAHPFVFLATAVVAVITAIYEFGDAINLNADKSITLMGAVVGIWRTFKEVVVEAWTALQPLIGPVWDTFKTIVTATFNAIMIPLRLFLDLLGVINPTVKKQTDSVVDNFERRLVNSMKKATDELRKTGDAGKESSEKFVAAELQKRLAMEASERATKRMADQQKQMSKSADLELGIYQDRVANAQRDSKAFLQAMGSDVSAAAIQINQAWHHAADDPDAGLLAYRQRMNEAAETNREVMVAIMRKTREGAAEVGSSMKVMADAYKKQQDAASQMSTLTVNAMGKVVQAQDSWAARSGALYNEMSEDVKNYAEDTITQTDRIRSQYSKVTSSITEATEAVHNFSGVADPRFSGIPPGMSKILMEAGIDIGEFQRALVGQSIHYGHPGGAAAQENLFRFFQGLTSDQTELLKRLGLGYAQGTDFVMPGSGGKDSRLFTAAISPGERVRVQTPAQQREDANGRGVVNHYSFPTTIVTPDANSFKESEPQIMRRFAARLARVQSRTPV